MYRNDNEIQEVMGLALDIHSNTDATLEEAMGIALEASADPIYRSFDKAIKRMHTSGKINRSILSMDRKFKESYYKAAPANSKIKGFNKISKNYVKMQASRLNDILIEIISMYTHANAAISNKKAYTDDDIVKHGEKIIEQMADFINVRDSEVKYMIDLKESTNSNHKIHCANYGSWVFINTFKREFPSLYQNAIKVANMVPGLDDQLKSTIQLEKMVASETNPAKKEKYRKELIRLSTIGYAVITIYEDFGEIKVRVPSAF